MRVRYPEGQRLVLTHRCAECGAGLYLALGRDQDGLYYLTCRNGSLHEPISGTRNNPIWQSWTSPAPSSSNAVEIFTYA
ncbi:MAG: hypothetical protein QF714_10005 [Dehalococcoidia bacterium]|jgi:hypothetical protein|nr:hypothetical protein [Dehalococcoidia bacterium]MDP6228014.1 hypothetical protein [Dehalococcoidia bacterium]MDP7084974.1 hypothetical protein [Dehalococcoidia bacterium]MDP7201729.1 hypothetical protein [Dehalococcoidia bacterium]HJN88588.1 hypothetical protein [Dehalococcoidia bacterium]